MQSSIPASVFQPTAGDRGTSAGRPSPETADRWEALSNFPPAQRAPPPPSAAPPPGQTPHGIATTYLAAGLSTLPAGREKRPIGTWKRFQTELPTEGELGDLFTPNTNGLGFVCGAVSGNLEVIDFDLSGAMFAPWKEIVEREATGLFEKLAVERTPSGGYHVFSRCESPVEGNQKLAERIVDGKRTTGIETRGEGGWIVVAPSPGYELIQGDFTGLPVLAADERDLLLTAAQVLTEVIPEPVKASSSGPSDAGSLRPGDDFNARGDVRALLENRGWKLVFDSDNQHWRRPGKTTGMSATLKDRVFYCFSSNAAPFEPDTAYAPFSVFAMLEHNSDFAAAASALRRDGFGEERREHGHDAGFEQGGVEGEPATEPAIKTQRIEFKTWTCAELMTASMHVDYLIEDLLVAGQPCILAGPKKSLKTSLLIDLVLSLATGGYFLGRFPVASECRVGVMTGESGMPTIQDTIRRIAEAARTDPYAIDNLLISDVVPRFGVPAYDLAFRDFINSNRLDVVVVDPAYMAIDGADAGNLFSMGEKLRSPAEICQEHGTTLILAHHTRKNVGRDDPYRPAELEDIAWAGFQEFARQWLLVNRREKYEPGTGEHKLWLSVGGSAGHSSLHGIDIAEGIPPDRFWSVDVNSAGDVRQAAGDRKVAGKEKAKAEQEVEAQKRVVRAMTKFPNGETKETIRTRAGLGATRFGVALAELLDDGTVTEARLTKDNGHAYNGFKLVQGADYLQSP